MLVNVKLFMLCGCGGINKHVDRFIYALITHKHEGEAGRDWEEGLFGGGAHSF